ncbi:MAG: exopolysaccharide biosynthesis protein, partial [Brevundimonas sp.]|nr:exopolysaccharide biosynthesis protein [Brevundimonas sp.]
LFLKRFVETTKVWAHFDIFGWNPADRPHGVTGGEAQAIRAIERLSQPRLLLLTSPVSETAIGLVCTLLAVIVMLPLWSTNMFPAFTIAVFGFGMMQRDGVAVLLGWLATAGYALFLVLAWRIIEGLLRAAWAWAGGLF